MPCPMTLAPAPTQARCRAAAGSTAIHGPRSGIRLLPAPQRLAAVAQQGVQPVAHWWPPHRQATAVRQGLATRAAALDEVEAADAARMPVDGGVFIEGVTFEDGTYTVRGRLESAASPELVYEVLTDYGSLARVFHNVLESRLLSVGDEKHLVQTCKWAFLIFSGTFVTSLAVSEDPVARRLAFHLVQSSFMRQFVGRWEVSAAPAPASPAEQAGLAARGVHAAASVTRHSLSVRPSVSPPAAVAHYTSKIFVRQVESILHDLQAELRRRQTAAEHQGGQHGQQQQRRHEGGEADRSRQVH